MNTSVFYDIDSNLGSESEYSDDDQEVSGFEIILSDFVDSFKQICNEYEKGYNDIIKKHKNMYHKKSPSFLKYLLGIDQPKVKTTLKFPPYLSAYNNISNLVYDYI